MRHQYAAAGEFQKFRQNLLHQRRILHHIVPNARKLLYLKGDWHLRIDKRRKAIQHLAVPELYRTDLNDAVVHGRESGGLNIKYHKISFKLSLLVSRDDLFQVIHQISFHPVNDLEKILPIRFLIPGLLALRRLLLPQIRPNMIGIGKALYYSMICDGYGPVPPFISPLYDILGLGYPVKVAHLGMAVQFHPLMACRIHSHGSKIFYFPDSRQRTDGQFMVELVQQGHALDLDEASRLQRTRQLLHVLVLGKQFHRHGIREIRHVEHDNGSFILDLPGIHLDDLAPENHLAYLSYHILDGHGFLLEIPAVNHVWIIRLLQGTGIAAFSELSTLEASLA